MPKSKIYLDTSVLGAIYDTEHPHRVETTRHLLDILGSSTKYSAFISNIVIEEIEKAPSEIRMGLKRVIDEMKPEVIYEKDECIELVNEYLRKKVIPRGYRDDARHIAVAVVHNMDVIVSWNCRHMANIEKKRLVNAVNLMSGHRQIDIVTPLEVIGHE